MSTRQASKIIHFFFLLFSLSLCLPAYAGEGKKDTFDNARSVFKCHMDGIRPDVLEKMLGKGLLPHFKMLIERGVMAKNFSTIFPSETYAVMLSTWSGLNSGKTGISGWWEAIRTGEGIEHSDYAFSKIKEYNKALPEKSSMAKYPGIELVFANGPDRGNDKRVHIFGKQGESIITVKRQKDGQNLFKYDIARGRDPFGYKDYNYGKILDITPTALAYLGYNTKELEKWSGNKLDGAVPHNIFKPGSIKYDGNGFDPGLPGYESKYSKTPLPAVFDPKNPHDVMKEKLGNIDATRFRKWKEELGYWRKFGRNYPKSYLPKIFFNYIPRLLIKKLLGGSEGNLPDPEYKPEAGPGLVEKLKKTEGFLKKLGESAK